MTKRDHQLQRREFFQLSGLGLISMRFLDGCSQPAAGNQVAISVEGDYRIIRTNGIPDHPTGEFPNPHCPGAIRAQDRVWRVSAKPEAAAALTPIGFTVFGVAINGVAFDPAGPHLDGVDTNDW